MKLQKALIYLKTESATVDVSIDITGMNFTEILSRINETVAPLLDQAELISIHFYEVKDA